MNTANYKLREFLLQKFPDAISASNNSEVVIRCRFCGDSRNLSSRHLYITVGDEDKPPMYHCFKCNESGILTRKVLEELLQYDSDPSTTQMLFELDKISSNFKQRYHKSEEFTKRNIVRTIYHDPSAKDIEKVSYINSRLGLNLSYEELINNKIITDINYTLTNMGIVRKYMPSENSIGFLSIDNTAVMCREMYSDRRYLGIRIIPNGVNYYCLKAICNRMSLEPIHIRIAEGPFDILSIFYNVCGGNTNQNIYLAANGKNFQNVIRYTLSIFSIANAIIDIYPDNDVDNNFYRDIASKLAQINVPVYVHRNGYRDEKDFGVSRDKIMEYTDRLF